MHIKLFKWMKILPCCFTSIIVVEWSECFTKQRGCDGDGDGDGDCEMTKWSSKPSYILIAIGTPYTRRRKARRWKSGKCRIGAATKDENIENIPEISRLFSFFWCGDIVFAYHQNFVWYSRNIDIFCDILDKFPIISYISTWLKKIWIKTLNKNCWVCGSKSEPC